MGPCTEGAAPSRRGVCVCVFANAKDQPFNSIHLLNKNKHVYSDIEHVGCPSEEFRFSNYLLIVNYCSLRSCRILSATDAMRGVRFKHNIITLFYCIGLVMLLYTIGLTANSFAKYGFRISTVVR